MYYLSALDDFIGLDEIGVLGVAKAKTKCSGKQVLINGKCYAPASAAAQSNLTQAQAAALATEVAAAPVSTVTRAEITAAKKAVAAQVTAANAAAQTNAVTNLATGAAQTNVVSNININSSSGTCPGKKVSSPYTGKCVAPNSPAATGVCPGSKVLNPNTGTCLSAAQAAKLGIGTTNTGCPTGYTICSTTGICGLASNPCGSANTGTCPSPYVLESTGYCSNGQLPTNTGTNTILPGYTECSNGAIVPIGQCPSGTCGSGQQLCPDMVTCAGIGAAVQVCPNAVSQYGTTPGSQCPAGSYLDSMQGSMTYGQCVPNTQQQLQSQLQSSGGGGGGGGPSSGDSGQGAPGSALTDGAAPSHVAPKSNTMMYLAIGALAIGGLYLFSKSKKGKRK